VKRRFARDYDVSQHFRIWQATALRDSERVLHCMHRRAA
jgi:hypothetical protein